MQRCSKKWAILYSEKASDSFRTFQVILGILQGQFWQSVCKHIGLQPLRKSEIESDCLYSRLDWTISFEISEWGKPQECEKWKEFKNAKLVMYHVFNSRRFRLFEFTLAIIWWHNSSCKVHSLIIIRFREVLILTRPIFIALWWWIIQIIDHLLATGMMWSTSNSYWGQILNHHLKVKFKITLNNFVWK